MKRVRSSEKYCDAGFWENFATWQLWNPLLLAGLSLRTASGNSLAGGTTRAWSSRGAVSPRIADTLLSSQILPKLPCQVRGDWGISFKQFPDTQPSSLNSADSPVAYAQRERERSSGGESARERERARARASERERGEKARAAQLIWARLFEYGIPHCNMYIYMYIYVYLHEYIYTYVYTIYINVKYIIQYIVYMLYVRICDIVQ